MTSSSSAAGGIEEVVQSQTVERSEQQSWDDLGGDPRLQSELLQALHDVFEDLFAIGFEHGSQRLLQLRIVDALRHEIREHAKLGAPLLAHRPHLAQGPPDLVHGLAGRIPGVPHALAHQCGAAIEHLRDEIVLALEVVVHRPLAHAGGGRDIAHAGA